MKTVRKIFYALCVVLVSLPVYAQDQAIEHLRQTGKAFASVAKEVSPSVVFVQVEGHAQSQGSMPFNTPFGEGSPFGDEFFRRFFGTPVPPKQDKKQPPKEERRIMGQGSGFVFKVDDGLLKDKSYILTNNHVVEDAEKILVKFKDGKEFEAKVKGRDPQSDVAVLEISSIDAPALKLADSSKLDVGEWVVAIGNPFGLSHTLTVGVVSAKGRTSVGLNDYEDFIQTDAAINPGNSGGPLINLDGEVVGINTAIFSRSGGYMGIGFAIPINMAKQIAAQLIDKGEVTRGFLGIVIQSLTPELADSFKIEKGEGILVAEVSEDGAGKKAGLKQGDVIVSYRGKPVTDVGDFRNRVSLTQPGEQADLTLIRDGKRKTLKVTIGARSSSEVVATKGDGHAADELGVTVQNNSGDEGGVVVTQVEAGSLAARSGITTGTVILQINQEKVNSTADFKRLMSQASKQKRVLMLLRSGDAQRYVVLKW